VPLIIGDASFCGTKLFQGRLIAIVSLGATVLEVWRSHFFLFVISAGRPGMATSSLEGPSSGSCRPAPPSCRRVRCSKPGHHRPG